jgi:hypothetical protein
MSRFFAAWIGLGIVAMLVTFVVTLAVFRHVDLTFTQFAILLVAPAAQAAVLVWPAGLVTTLGAESRSAWRHRLAAPLLVLDLVMLSAGMTWWSSSALGFGASVTIQPTWIAVKAFAAACLCVTGAQGLSIVRRSVLCLVLLLVAGQAQWDVLERLFAAIDQRAQWLPEVLLRFAWYGGLYIAGVIAVLRVIHARHDAARVWVSTAVALSVPGVLLVVLSMFNHPGVLPPWRGLALVCASAAVTALTLGVLMTSAKKVRS